MTSQSAPVAFRHIRCIIQNIPKKALLGHVLTIFLMKRCKPVNLRVLRPSHALQGSDIRQRWAWGRHGWRASMRRNDLLREGKKVSIAFKRLMLHDALRGDRSWVGEKVSIAS